MGQTMMSLVLRYPAPSEFDPHLILQEVLRSVPPVQACTFSSLRDELRELADYYVALCPPDYPMAENINNACKRIDDMQRQGKTEMEIQRWMAIQIKQRKKHRKYLQHVQAAEERIDAAERGYAYKLKRQMEEMNLAIHFVRTTDEYQPELFASLPPGDRFHPDKLWSITELQK
eukprot:GHVS01003429.1.p2 GENE.GHVS01003429.1~~GHVS01003429.1.p2  ORF type:complete len:174 (+),score=25.61 GHVS01003429.1:963-1484(+)